MQVNFRWWESTIKDVTARNQGVSRSTVNASKLRFSALKIVNAWTAKTLKGVKKEELPHRGTIIP